MFHGRLKTCLVLLVSAALLCGGLMPPAVQHAHADGERPHSHSDTGSSGTARADDCGEPSPAHSHAHRHAQCTHARRGHSHPHDPPKAGRIANPSCMEETGEPEAVAAHTPHVHLRLLWFELTLPANERDGRRHGAAEWDASPIAFVRLLDEDVRPPTPAPDAAPAVELSTATRPEAPTRSLAGREASAGPAVTACLCDSARHERSGVQLS